MSMHWIANAVAKHKGALHRALGLATGTKIPVKKLSLAAKRPGKVGKQARLALTLRSFH